MHQQSFGFVVTTSDENEQEIRILQFNLGREDDDSILLHVDQVDYLCAWLQQAKREIESKKGEGHG
jgi:hypothetical protein